MLAPPFDDIALGPLTLHIYGLLIGIGIVCALQLIEVTARWQGIERQHLTPIAIPTIIMGFIGARLYHVISRPEFFADNPGEIAKIWHGGLGIWGGVLFGVVTGALVAKRRGVPVLKLIDAGAPATIVAQALGRWGNYFNQELFGSPTDLPWALDVDREFRPEGFESNETFHPTFLYESIWNLLVMALLLVLLRRWNTRCDGVVFAIYVAAYTAARFFIEGLRIDDAHVFMGLRQNEWVSLVLFVLAASFIVWKQFLQPARDARRSH